MKSEAQFYWGSAQQPFWRPGPNPTVDLVIFGDEVDPEGENDELSLLLIKRSKASLAEPEKYAFPGGFHDSNALKGEPWKEDVETDEQAAIRELKEEAGIELTPTERIIKVGVYEGAGRDPRDNKEAWSRDTAFILRISVGRRKLKAGDDAEKAEWIALSKALGMSLAFDHNKILIDACRKLNIPLPKDIKPIKPKM
jgi:ADP-ribose pyrophosphatase YjhB (NUDIX family)